MTSIHISTNMNMDNFANTPTEFHYDMGDFADTLEDNLKSKEFKLVDAAGMDTELLDALVGYQEKKPRPLTMLAELFVEDYMESYGDYIKSPPKDIYFHCKNFSSFMGALRHTIMEIIGILVKKHNAQGLSDCDLSPINNFFIRILAPPEEDENDEEDIEQNIPQDVEDDVYDDDAELELTLEDENLAEDIEKNDRLEMLAKVKLPTKEIVLIVTSEQYINLLNLQPMVAKTVSVKSEKGVSSYRAVDQSKIVLSDQITRSVYFLMKPASRSSAGPYLRTFSENKSLN